MAPIETENQAENYDQIVPMVVEEEMKTAYINYAMSVIVGRALPDIRDGLKPVHRRILYAMYDLGMFHNKPSKKCARIIGEVLGKYHPHGDTAVYDSLVRMAQDFSLRYPLIKGQGNFGSIDGDSAAAMRYTEAKLQRLAEEMLKDIEKDTVDFKDNFDGSLKEPVVLPNKIPNLLINGSSGIAVGMATNIPPHNVREICDGIVALIDNPEITVQELMGIIPAPDFPTGGEVICGSALMYAYSKGRGKVKIKAISEIEGDKIIIKEIPYQVNKEDLIVHIANLVKNKTIAGIRNINDESDREGIRVVIEIKQGTDPQVLLNQLYKHSRLSVSFGINLLALVNNEPKILGLKDFLQHHINHRIEVIRRRTFYDLEQAQKRLHILEGLLIALDKIDEVVAGIRKSANVDDARQFLIGDYSLSDEQAKAILDLKLQKLAALEQHKIRDEHSKLLEDIKLYQEILGSSEKVLSMIKEELTEMKEKYGDERRSKIIVGEDEDVDFEDLIEEGMVVVTMTNSGYVKRITLNAYKTQGRGGKGVKAVGMKEEDFIEKLYVVSTHDYLLFFTDAGQVYWQKVYHIPEGSRQAKGRHIANLLEMQPNEKITAVVPVRDFKEGYLFMATKKGTVKKTELEDFSRPRKGGIRAITLDEGDSLIGVKYTAGDKEIILATKNGQANRFKEGDVRVMGRTARGVRGIRLKGNDVVVGMLAAEEDKKILTLTEKGYGKRTPISDYRLCNRGGSGVTNIKITEKNGPVKIVQVVDGIEELMLVSTQGIGIRIKCASISVIGRATQGVRVMRLGEGDKLAAAAKIVNDDEEAIELEEPLVEETNTEEVHTERVEPELEELDVQEQLQEQETQEQEEKVMVQELILDIPLKMDENPENLIGEDDDDSGETEE